MSSWVNLSEYGRMRGCSSQSVKVAIENGRLVKSVRRKENGKWEVQPDAANIEWEISTSHKNRPAHLNVRSESPGRVKVVRENVELVDNVNEGKTPLFEAQRRHEIAKAEMAELKLAELKSTLVNAEDVKSEAFKLARNVRDGMLNIADRVAAEFAGMTVPHSIHARLTEEIHKALETMAGTA